MKLLVLGIDAADEKIIRGLRLPNLTRILDDNISENVKEDLLSRGWSKILTGVGGEESGGLYTYPVRSKDGFIDVSQKYNTKDYLKNENVKPIWELLNERGYTVGLMNVPTTNPAPKVDGFFVSGAGGGMGDSNTFPVNSYYPSKIEEVLEEEGYIFDTRVLGSGIREINELCNRYREMTEIRTRTFLRLVNNINVDFGFVAYMTMRSIQNLYFSEIEDLISNNCEARNTAQSAILDLYTFFDQNMAELLGAVNPEKILLLSDHGSAAYKYNVNLNRFLDEENFQLQKTQGTSVAKTTLKAIANILPQSYKSRLKKQFPKAASFVQLPPIDWKKSQAFSVDYVPGIFINDTKRFEGIVDDYDVDGLVEDIIRKFNSQESMQKHRLVAKEYRKNHKGSFYEDLLPDIWIEHDDEYYFSMTGDLIRLNSKYDQGFEDFDSDLHSGIKGSCPVVSHNIGRTFSREDHPNDLTLAYEIIKEVMQ